MCRPNALGGRRCPSHTDPVFVANRNARRRANYHKSHTSQLNVESLLRPLEEYREAVIKGSETYKQFIRSGRTFNQRLTDEERKTVYEYTALGFRGVRDYLNGHRIHDEDEKYDASEDEIAKMKQQVAAIDSALEKAPKPRQPRVLYRGMVFPWSAHKNTNEWIEERFPVGGVIHQKSYISTSLKMKSAKKFTGITQGRGFMMEIVSSSGAALNHETSDYGESEREILLPRDQKFKVLEIIPDAEINYEDAMFKRTRRETAKMTIIRLIDVTLLEEE